MTIRLIAAVLIGSLSLSAPIASAHETGQDGMTNRWEFMDGEIRHIESEKDRKEAEATSQGSITADNRQMMMFTGPSKQPRSEAEVRREYARLMVENANLLKENEDRIADLEQLIRVNAELRQDLAEAITAVEGEGMTWNLMLLGDGSRAGSGTNALLGSKEACLRAAESLVDTENYDVHPNKVAYCVSFGTGETIEFPS